MKRGLSMLLALHAMASAALAAPLRVACVGDSITYGDQLADRAAQAYPAVLERLSRGRYATGNFGVNGATALNRIPFRSWTDAAASRDALAFAPDIVVVMLGINDLAFPDRFAQYPDALRDLLARFQALPAAPRLLLCTLTPIAPAERQAHANQLIRDAFNPAIRAVAAAAGAQLVDIHAAFPNRPDLLPDGLHPSPEGAELLARAILEALDAPAAAAPRIHPAPAAGPVDLSIRNEARAARVRAERWLAAQPPPADLRDLLAPGEPDLLRAREDAARHLPLLGDARPRDGEELFYACAALAMALDRLGEETVFPAPDRPVAWREALLHQLVQRQKNDARGGGFWQDPAAADPVPAAVRSTTYALRAIAAALGGE